MVEVNLQINKELFLEWLGMADMTQEKFAKEVLAIDDSNFSKMLDGKITTPKHVLEKVLGRTLLPHGRILVPVMKEEGAK